MLTCEMKLNLCYILHYRSKDIVKKNLLAEEKGTHQKIWLMQKPRKFLE